MMDPSSIEVVSKAIEEILGIGEQAAVAAERKAAEVSGAEAPSLITRVQIVSVQCDKEGEEVAKAASKGDVAEVEFGKKSIKTSENFDLESLVNSQRTDVTVQNPYQQTVQLPLSSNEPATRLVRMRPPQEDASERLRISNSTAAKALFVCCEKWLAETAVAIAADNRSSFASFIARQPNHELVKAFAKSRDNVSDAHKVGDDPLALAWIQVAEDFQQAIKESIKKMEAARNGNLHLSDAWRDTVQVTQKMAEYRSKYITATTLLGSPEIVSEWKKVVTQSESIVNYYRRATELQEHSFCSVLHRTSSLFTGMGPLTVMSDTMFLVERHVLGHTQRRDYLKKVVSFTEKAAVLLDQLTQLQEENSEELVGLYLKTIEQYQESVQYYLQAVDILFNRFLSKLDSANEVQGVDGAQKLSVQEQLASLTDDVFNKKVASVVDSACQLEKVAMVLEKAIQARKANQEEVATLCLKIVKKFEEHAEYTSQVSNAKLCKNKTKQKRYEEAADAALKIANELERTVEAFEKTFQAREINQEEIATLWLKIARQSEESTEYTSQATNIQAKKIDIQRFDKAHKASDASISALLAAISAFERSTKAKEVHMEELENQWLKVVSYYQEYADYKRQIAQAVINGNANDYDRLEKAASAVGGKAGVLEKELQRRERLGWEIW